LSNPAHEPLKYPYRWGHRVCQTFLESHTRGRKNFATLLEIDYFEVTHKLAIVLCRGKSVKFETLKRCIKILDDYSDETLARFSPKERELLYKWIVYLCTEEELDAREGGHPLDLLANHFLSY